MSFLLDTHVLLWWLDDDRRLSHNASAAIANPANEVFVSAATAWEIGIKQSLGKLVGPADLAAEVYGNQFMELPVHLTDAIAAGKLPPLHSDPFDRMLIAQAQINNLTLVTRDRRITEYDIATLQA